MMTQLAKKIYLQKYINLFLRNSLHKINDLWQFAIFVPHLTCVIKLSQVSHIIHATVCLAAIPRNSGDRQRKRELFLSYHIKFESVLQGFFITGN